MLTVNKKYEVLRLKNYQFSSLTDTQSLMFGGNTLARYMLQTSLPVRSRRQGNAGTMRSSLTEELSLRFRTENENGILFHMSGSGSTGDSASIQVP